MIHSFTYHSFYVLHIFSIYDSDDFRSSVGGYMAFAFLWVMIFFFFRVYFMDCLKEHWRFL